MAVGSAGGDIRRERSPRAGDAGAGAGWGVHRGSVAGVGAQGGRAGNAGRRAARHAVPMPTIPETLRAAADRQWQVVTTAQCRAAGVEASWVDRRVRTGQWQRLHRGVLVTHSGPVPWRARAWAALAVSGAGAALSHESAGYLHEILPSAPRILTVSIPHERRVTPGTGLVVVRRRAMPPSSGQLRTVDRPTTVLDLVAAAASEDQAIGILCAAGRARIWPEEIVGALDRRGRTRRATTIRELLALVEAGIESPLELRYHRDVERRHRLPAATLQQRSQVDGHWIRADCVYERLGVRIELDGALAHPGGRTDRDVWRDNAVVLRHHELTLRYRWSHVALQPCATAAQVATALRAGGWTGGPHPCHPACAVSAHR